MILIRTSRRNVLITSAAIVGGALMTGVSGRFAPVQAQSVAPTPSMRGGDNNYLPGAALVERIGAGGFQMTGMVRRASDGAPLAGRRIQVWAHTTEGHERDPHSHGATLTDKDGMYRMNMPQIVPAFGQPHAHLAYDTAHDDGGFATVFLRPVMRSASETSLRADFVLRQA